VEPNTPIGTPLEPRNVSRAFQQLCYQAGIRNVRLHDLRYSAASFLLLQGVDPKMVQVLLRHTRFRTTADLYLHVPPELARDASDRLEQLLWSATAG
jgi:integrase